MSNLERHYLLLCIVVCSLLCVPDLLYISKPDTCIWWKCFLFFFKNYYDCFKSYQFMSFVSNVWHEKKALTIAGHVTIKHLSTPVNAHLSM